MEIDDIASINLNDSDITEIRVNSRYEIELHLNLITDYHTQASETCVLVFQDCQSAALDLKLAFSGPNSILKGFQTKREDGFVEYEIETNTTASKIRVTSRRLLLSRCPPDSPLPTPRG
jgi:hypothetical protein